MSIPKSVTKAHATGNDFIAYLDSDGRFEPTADEVRQLCDRHFGIGADGLLRLTKPQYVADLSEAQVAACDDGDAEWFMDYRNADGSLAEMCGNGTRAITLFAQRCGVASTQVGSRSAWERAPVSRRCARSATWRHTAGMCSAWTWAHGGAATLTPSR